MSQKVYALLLNGINILLPVLTVPIVTSRLGLEVYADFVISNVLYQLIISVTSSASLNFFIREFGRAESKDGDHQKILLTNIFSFQFYSFVLALIIYIFLGLFFDVYFWGHVIFGLSLLSILFNVEWFFYARQDFKTIFIRALVIRGVTLGLIFLFVKKSDDIDIYFIIMSVSVILYSYAGYHFSKLRIKKVYLSGYLLAFKNMKYFFFGSIVGIFYQFVDQLIVAMFSSKESLSIYNIIKQITNGLTTLPVTLIKYNMPAAIREYRTSGYHMFIKRSILFFLPLLTLISFTSFMLVDYIISFLVREKIEVLLDYKIFISLMIFFTSCAVFVDSHISIPSDRERITVTANISAVIVMLVVIFNFIQTNGLVGALYSLLLAEMTCVLIMVLMVFTIKSR